MASNKKINPYLKANNDTGFGSNPNSYGGRFINKDGSFNLRREGIPLLRRIGIYQRMISLPRWKFLAVILLFYFAINLFFTLLYLLKGAEQLQGLVSTTAWTRFKEVFYF